MNSAAVQRIAAAAEEHIVAAQVAAVGGIPEAAADNFDTAAVPAV